jgi:putative sigma-54 modulation protein
MEKRITARHFELTEELKDFAEKQLDRLSRYFNQIIDCHLVLELEKSRQSAELNVKVYGTVLTSKHRSFDMYESVEKVTDKMESQVKKYKGKLKDRKPKKGAPSKRGFGPETVEEETAESF